MLPTMGKESGPLKLLSFSAILGSFRVLKIKNASGTKNSRLTLKTKTTAFTSEMPVSMAEL
jgi:hypothetical protein